MDAVEEIKSRLSIEDVASQYFELKRSGRNFKALSPFTNEKTPSLMISPEKQIWHDFSSGKGGDMFSLVMELDGLDFRGALEMLARQAGVDLDQFKGSGAGKQKERVYDALELATKFYQVQFSKSHSTLEYVFKKRGYTKDTALAFRLGYSPNTDNALTKFLLGKGFQETELKQAGLSTKRYRGLGDMFRGRLMVPLMDGTGKVVGFTARILEEDKNAPKYINTPQSPVYDKSRHVFGLHLAKDAIRKQNFAVAVEGNLDVVASYQAGVRNVVATAGTAMTEYHLKALNRFTDDIRLAFDQDQAGLNATERAIPIASKVGVNISIVTVPEGKDPDELVKKNAQQWIDVIQNPQDAVEWVMGRYRQLLNLATAVGKRQYTDKVLAVVRDVQDPVQQEHYLHIIASELGIGAEALRVKLTQQTSRAKQPAHKPIKAELVSKPDADLIRAQNNLLALTYSLPSLRPFLEKLTTHMVPEERAQKLMNYLKAHPDFNDQKHTPDELRELADYVKMLRLLYEEIYQRLDVAELRYESTRLQTRLIESFVKMQKASLAEKMQRSNDEQTDALLEKAKELDVLLKSIKE